MEGGDILFSKKFLLVSLSILILVVAYSTITYGLSESCWSPNIEAIGCLKLSESCWMYCDITIADSYRLSSDIPVLVVTERGTQDVVAITEMDYVGTTDHCDEYDARPGVPCGAPYDVYIYINDTGGVPILSAPVIVCPAE